MLQESVGYFSCYITDAKKAVIQEHKLLDDVDLAAEYLHETSDKAVSAVAQLLEKASLGCADDQDEKQSTILVHGEDLDLEFLDLFFSNNAKSGGGKIREDGIKINERKTKALVSFKDSKGTLITENRT